MKGATDEECYLHAIRGPSVVDNEVTLIEKFPPDAVNNEAWKKPKRSAL